MPDQPTPDQIRSILRNVVDPEIGVNIVDLGLIYDIRIEAGEIRIALTMTSPACPMSDLVLSDAQAALAEAFPDAPPAAIDLVWNPPWEPARMSDKARATLGW
jgi:metal-sulfur cluster biosynthetic enzyme